MKIEVKRNRGRNGSGLVFLVDGNQEDQTRFGIICEWLQAERTEELAAEVATLARRNAESMNTLVSAIGDLTHAVDGLRADLKALGTEGIATRMNQEIERITVTAIETLGGLKG